MTKRSKYILDKSIEKTDLKETYLSIQISLDGFSFCIYAPISQTYLTFQHYDFGLQHNTPDQLLKLVQTIFDENNLLNQDYKKVNIIHQNELATLVPEEFFDEDCAKDYLKNNIKVLNNDFVSHDLLKNESAALVYIPYVNINNFIFSKFGAFEYFHSATLFIDLKNKLEQNMHQTKCYIHVHPHSFDVLVYKASSLIFFNHFNFQTAADFIYYVLFVMEQLELSPNEIETELSGEIEQDSELFKTAFQYIRNIRFYNIPNPKLSASFDEISRHSNYIDLHQF